MDRGHGIPRAESNGIFSERGWLVNLTNSHFVAPFPGTSPPEGVEMASDVLWRSHTQIGSRSGDIFLRKFSQWLGGRGHPAPSLGSSEPEGKRRRQLFNKAYAPLPKYIYFIINTLITCRDYLVARQCQAALLYGRRRL